MPQDDEGMMFRQVVRGLRYLHEVAQLVHRDIKLEMCSWTKWVYAELAILACL
jgi:serine/threonine protein kinase